MNNMCMCGGQCGGCGGKTAFVSRVLLAIVFLLAGWAKLTNFAGTEQMVAAAGFPVPALFAVLAIIFEFGGAIMLIVGFHARMAAWMLFVFSLIATLVYHNPFAQGFGTTNIMFLKNLAMMGGLLYMTSFGAGAWSLAKWNRKLCKGGQMCPDCRVEMEDAS